MILIRLFSTILYNFEEETILEIFKILKIFKFNCFKFFLIVLNLIDLKFFKFYSFQLLYKEFFTIIPSLTLPLFP